MYRISELHKCIGKKNKKKILYPANSKEKSLNYIIISIAWKKMWAPEEQKLTYKKNIAIWYIFPHTVEVGKDIV